MPGSHLQIRLGVSHPRYSGPVGYFLEGSGLKFEYLKLSLEKKEKVKLATWCPPKFLKFCKTIESTHAPLLQNSVQQQGHHRQQPNMDRHSTSTKINQRLALTVVPCTIKRFHGGKPGRCATIIATSHTYLPSHSRLCLSDSSLLCLESRKLSSHNETALHALEPTSLSNSASAQ